MKRIGVIIETENGQVKDTNFGMISLAAKGGAQLFALAADTVDPEVPAAYGAGTLVDLGLPDAPEIRQNPDVRARAVAGAVRELGLDGVFGLSSAEGRDLIPRVAACLDAPLVMDCLDVDPGTKTAKTTQYSGKVIADIQLSGDIVVFGIRPNAVKAKPAPVEAGTICLAEKPDTASALTLTAWDTVYPDDNQAGLSEADIIVAGGRGLKNKDNFSLLFDCAGKMNGAVGASRVAVDEGWIPYAHQVGQTGEKVSPAVYLAFGISGSIQHFAGMKTAGMIIAVNTDENAAMVANSDYYVIGDLFEILPALIQRL